MQSDYLSSIVTGLRAWKPGDQTSWCNTAATAITALQAERDAAWNEAIEAAAKYLEDVFLHDRAQAIRAMKKDA